MTAPNLANSSGAAPSESKASMWEDFVDIFYAPAQVFRRRAAGSWGAPLLVVTILIAVLTYANRGVLQAMYDAELDKALAPLKANPQMTPEILERARSFGEITAQFGSVVFVPIGILLMGLAVWVLSRVFGAKVTGNGALVVAAYGAVPWVVENLTWSVQGLLLDSSRLTSRLSLSLGAGRFVSPESLSPVAAAAINHVDVFSVWISALLAIGIVTIGNAPRSRALLIGAVIWVLGFAVPVLGALRSG